jgi:putative transposase
MSEKYKIQNPNGVYFCTMTVVDWIDAFTRKEYADTFIHAIRYYQKERGLVVHAWVIMPSHVHIIASTKDGKDLSPIIRDLKKWTSTNIVKQIQEIPESRREWMLHKFEWAGKFMQRIKNYKFWQDGNQPKECISVEFLRQKLEYVHNNPVVAGIVFEPWQYVYSSAGDYAGIKGLIDLEMIDLY